MFGYAQSAEWPLPKQKGATRWFVAAVASTSASAVARLSLVMSISGTGETANSLRLETEAWERQMEAMQIGPRMRIASRPIGGTVRCPKCRDWRYC
uniref:Uncharacterized protein n=1 Tax=Arundo donax TaxID=35708 RepID=A0A0A8ZB51_ARUDO